VGTEVIWAAIAPGVWRRKWRFTFHNLASQSTKTNWSGRTAWFEHSRPTKLANAEHLPSQRQYLVVSRFWRVPCRTESNESSLAARPSSYAQVEKPFSATAGGVLLKAVWSDQQKISP